MRPVIHRFDIVAVGIKRKSGVVARMVAPLPWRAVVPPAGRKNRCMEAIDHGAVLRLEGEVHVSDRGTDIDPQLIGKEVTVPLDEGNLEGRERRLVEALGRIEIVYFQVEVIDQPPAMNFHKPALPYQSCGQRPRHSAVARRRTARAGVAGTARAAG